MADRQLMNPDLPLVLGGNTFGWTSNEEETFAVLDVFLEAGGSHVDTADQYSFWVPGNEGGESETVLGNYLAARRNRDDMFLATKVGGWDGRPGLSVENVKAAVDDSLARLQTDHIDLYYAHYDDESQSAQQLAQTFHDLVEDRKIRHIAMSNFTPQRQAAWIAAAKEAGLTVPSAIQPNYSLAHRSDYEGSQGFGTLAEQHQLAVFPYASLASGLLTGKYRKLADFDGVAREGMLEQYADQTGLDLVENLVQVANEVGAEPAAVALKWLLVKGVTASIASARTPEQLKPLIAAPNVELSEDHIAHLDKASEAYL